MKKHLGAISNQEERRLNKDQVHVALYSQEWKDAALISLSKLGQHLRIDPNNLKVHVQDNKFLPGQTIYEKFKDQHVYFENPPVDASIHVNNLVMTTDGYYLYVWIESLNKWKRAILNDL